MPSSRGTYKYERQIYPGKSLNFFRRVQMTSLMKLNEKISGTMIFLTGRSDQLCENYVC